MNFRRGSQRGENHSASREEAARPHLRLFSHRVDFSHPIKCNLLEVGVYRMREIESDGEHAMGRLGPRTALSALEGGPQEPRKRCGVRGGVHKRGPTGPHGMRPFHRGPFARPQGLSFHGFRNLAGAPQNMLFARGRGNGKGKREKRRRNTS